jgi:hypothetical protein
MCIDNITVEWMQLLFVVSHLSDNDIGYRIPQHSLENVYEFYKPSQMSACSGFR